MNAQAALQSYAKVQYRATAEVASPHQLIQMLFDGALERIQQAKGALVHRNIELKGKRINSAIGIVGGLRESLDKSAGGELAENLDNVYRSVQMLLAAAHRDNDVAKLDQAALLLIDISSAWRQIGKGA